MSSSFTATESSTFTITNARHMSAKVATDLQRMNRLYGKPSLSKIKDFEEEVTQLLKHGYLKKVTYGFKRGNKMIEPTLIYTAEMLSYSEANDDDPGRVKPGKDVTGATFYSHLSYTSSWFNLSSDDRNSFEASLPFQRGEADEPGTDGYYDRDKTYSSGGRALNRSTLRSY